MELTTQQKEDILKGTYFIVEGVGAPEVKIRTEEKSFRKKVKNLNQFGVKDANYKQSAKY